jgi:D-alanyl-D-alanine carboxypeptidase
MHNRLPIVLLIISGISVLNSLEFQNFNIGYSADKKPIEIYQFGRGNEVVFLIAGIHGNEPNTVKTAREIIDRLKQSSTPLPANKSLWIIPNLNPDGYDRGRRLNNNSVDLNRNFPTRDWKPYFYLFSNRISAGARPLSEPETSAIHLFFQSLDPSIRMVVLSLHSKGNAVIPGNKEYYNQNLTCLVQDSTGYYFNTVGYDTHGDLTRYLAEKWKIASVTVELKTKTDPETDTIHQTLQQLLLTDLSQKIYEKNFSLENLFKIKHEDKLERLIKDLPDKVQKKILQDHTSKINFIDSFEKLNDRDELLLLVNKTTALSASYKPDDLTEITRIFPTDKQNIFLSGTVIEDLRLMIDEALEDGIKLKIISAYRSYETQKSVYQHWVNLYGEAEASRISAKPGTSQHQLGTAIDFNSLSDDFYKTKTAQWLRKHGLKYGFVISYPEDMEEITGYKFEPWHYRYIGKDAAFIVWNYFDDNLELFLNWYWNSNTDR